MNRYVGNNVVERIPEPDTAVASAPVYFGGGTGGVTVQPQGSGPASQGSQGAQAGQNPGGEGRKPPGHALPGGGLSGLLSKLGDKISIPELEDVMLIAFMYLLYRETGDVEFLLMGGALLLG